MDQIDKIKNRLEISEQLIIELKEYINILKRHIEDYKLNSIQKDEIINYLLTENFKLTVLNNFEIIKFI